MAGFCALQCYPYVGELCDIFYAPFASEEERFAMIVIASAQMEFASAGPNWTAFRAWSRFDDAARWMRQGIRLADDVPLTAFDDAGDALGLARKGVPRRRKVALGQWEQPSFHSMADKLDAIHLGGGKRGIGADVFGELPNPALDPSGYEAAVMEKTKGFLMSPGTKSIEFDLTMISASAKQFDGISSGGYFARRELEMIIETPELMKKAHFHMHGRRLWWGSALTESQRVARQRYLRWLLK